MIDIKACLESRPAVRKKNGNILWHILMQDQSEDSLWDCVATVNDLIDAMDRRIDKECDEISESALSRWQNILNE